MIIRWGIFLFLRSILLTVKSEVEQTEMIICPPSGGIICTKYVTFTENVQTVYESSIGKHILCVVCIILTMAYWNQYIPVNNTVQRLLPMKEKCRL